MPGYQNVWASFLFGPLLTGQQEQHTGFVGVFVMVLQVTHWHGTLPLYEVMHVSTSRQHDLDCHALRFLLLLLRFSLHWRFAFCMRLHHRMHKVSVSMYYLGALGQQLHRPGILQQLFYRKDTSSCSLQACHGMTPATSLVGQYGMRTLSTALLRMICACPFCAAICLPRCVITCRLCFWARSV